MSRKTFTSGKILLGRLPGGVDLLQSIARIANEEGIGVGRVEVFGTVARVSLTRLDPETRMQIPASIDEPCEIAALSGTISQFKRRSMPRLNGVFVRADGSTAGGVLALGTEVHVCEVLIEELTGGLLARDFDPETGLPLWKNGLLIERDEPEAGED